KELRETKVWVMIIHQAMLIKPQSRLQPIIQECDELISIFVKKRKNSKTLSQVFSLTSAVRNSFVGYSNFNSTPLVIGGGLSGNAADFPLHRIPRNSGYQSRHR